MILALFASIALAEVIFVMEFARHGTRTPLKSYHWSIEEPLGELTEEGYSEHLDIGKSLREAYPALLSEVYLPEEVYFRSTNYSRTLRSLEGQVKGLYPGIQDYSFETVDRESDYLLMPYHACPRIEWLAERDFKNSTKYLNFLTELLPFQNQIFRLTGESSLSHEPAFYLGDAFLSYESRGMALPEVDLGLVEFAKKTYEFYHSSMLFGNREALKISGHRLVQEILEQTKLVISGSKLRLAVYLTHDTALTAFLKALGFYQAPPQFSASLIIELHQLETQHFLKFIYQGQTLAFSECDELCQLDTFAMLSKDRLFASEVRWVKQCILEGDDKNGGWYTLMKLGLGISFFLGLGLLIQRMLQRVIDSRKKKI
jgi:prostatic aicd phosphatase